MMYAVAIPLVLAVMLAGTVFADEGWMPVSEGSVRPPTRPPVDRAPPPPDAGGPGSR